MIVLHEAETMSESEPIKKENQVEIITDKEEETK